MADGMGFLMRPITKNMCQMDRLYDRVLSLWDFVLMNDALDVLEENTYRMSLLQK
jgi:hypothetical protein